jgi:hypothetical protein
MNATAKMKKTMEQMMSNSGHTVKVRILPLMYTVETTLPNGPDMKLTFSDMLTPGEVVFQTKTILDKLSTGTA